jgi:predicted acyltransferase
MISVVKDCFGGSSWCCVSRLVLYCFHSHSSLIFGIVIKRFPMSVNMWASSFMIYMAGCDVSMSLSGLHSCRFI